MRSVIDRNVVIGRIHIVLAYKKHMFKQHKIFSPVYDVITAVDSICNIFRFYICREMKGT